MLPYFSISITRQLAGSVGFTSRISIMSSHIFPFLSLYIGANPLFNYQDFGCHFLIGLHVLHHQKIDVLQMWLLLHKVPTQKCLMTPMTCLVYPNTFITSVFFITSGLTSHIPPYLQSVVTPEIELCAKQVLLFSSPPPSLCSFLCLDDFLYNPLLKSLPSTKAQVRY